MAQNFVWSLVLGALVIPFPITPANAQARFINLSDENVYLARWTYTPYSSNSGGLTVITPAGWNFTGWYSVPPGTSREFEAGDYYVEGSRRGPITWSNLSTSWGLIKDGGEKFSAFLPKYEDRAGTSQNDKLRELLRTGHREVDYQTFGDANWKISGNAYRLRNTSFNFNFSSRAPTLQSQSFQVPGQAAFVHITSSKHWGATNIRWRTDGKYAFVRLWTEGAQKRPFGPREPGYYRGRVKVYYIQPR